MKLPYIILPLPFLLYDAMAVFPFIFVKRYDYRYDHTLINHEKIHLKQQLELLIVPFYLFYIGHYIFNLIKYKNHHEAYMSICFEREAYENELDLNYLQERRWWSFWKYL